MDSTYVVPLSDPAAGDRSLAGGKGAVLADLAAADFPVPEGFVVTTEAYRALVADSAVPDLVATLAKLDADGPDPTGPDATGREADSPDSDGPDDHDPDDSNDPDATRVAADLREAIRESALPGAVREAVADAVEATDPADAFAVRSSATVEDLPGASAAGQHETVLNVSGVEAVADAVRACMASLFSERAVRYRAENGLSHADAEMAVVVQRLVDPDVSGTLFTADPVTGTRHVSTVEAGYGLGEAQVSGEITADRVRLDARTGEVLDYEVGDKRVAVRPDPAGGTETVEVPATDRERRALADEQARDLLDLGAAVEAELDGPQDVEWAVEDGRLALLQARPVTALFPVPEPPGDDDGLRVYYDFGHSQEMTGAMPPLVVDVWGRILDDVAAGIGVDEPVSTRAGGRVYVDLTPLLERPRFRNALFAQDIDEVAGETLRAFTEARPGEFEVESPDGLPARLADSLGFVAGLLRRYAPVAYRFPVALLVAEPAGVARRTREWLSRRTEAATARIRSGESHADRIDAGIDEVGGSLVWLYDRIHPFLAANVAKTLLERLFPDRQDDVDALGRAPENDVVVRMMRGVGDLAGVADERPAVASAIRDGAEFEAVADVDGGEAFVAALESFLSEFGFRAVDEIDLSSPRYREDRSGLLSMVRGALAPGAERPRERFRRLDREAAAATERLADRAGRRRLGFLERRLVRRLCRVHRTYLGVRQYPKAATAELLAGLREQLLAAGETLVDRGALDAPADVWFLRLDELYAALDGSGATREVDLADRRAAHERHRRLTAPRLVTSDGETPFAPDEGGEAPDGALVGTAVSPGVVEGRVRVVEDPREAGVEPGEILVAPYTDPGWTPLFLNAAGLVTEVGGRLMHGSLVARESGIPGVVSVPGATTRLDTGQRVRVDGSRGFVEPLADGAAEPDAGPGEASRTPDRESPP